jgi:hypothetical protein
MPCAITRRVTLHLTGDGAVPRIYEVSINLIFLLASSLFF